MAFQPLEGGDKFVTITEEKDLEDDSANFTITMSHWSCIILYMASVNLLSLYGNCLVIKLGL